MNKIKYILFLSIFMVLLFAEQKRYTVKDDIVINSNNGNSPVLINTD